MLSKTTEIAEGVTKGIISLGAKKIKSLAKKFLDKKLAFIQDEETIDLVKKQLKSGEWSLFNQYIKDKGIKLLVQMGLALRQLDKSKNETALLNLRTKILGKYDKKGLHTAEFVQSKILSDFVGFVVRKANSVEEIESDIRDLLANIETNVLFLQKRHDFKIKIREVHTRLEANAPNFFIIFTSKSAIKLGLKIKHSLEKELEDYEMEVLQEKNKLLIFLSKENTNLIEQFKNS